MIINRQIVAYLKCNVRMLLCIYNLLTVIFEILSSSDIYIYIANSRKYPVGLMMGLNRLIKAHVRNKGLTHI
jgi:hypothetical protein